MLQILLISTIAGLATGLGGLIVIVFNSKPTVKFLSFFLGLAAGINIIIATVELLPAALETGSLLIMCLGFILGIAVMSVIDKWLPPSTVVIENGTYIPGMVETGYLLAIGMAVHNLPEGLAIGAGHIATSSLGLVLALAIGIHNIPEGMCVAAPLKSGGVLPKKILLVTCLAGLATPIGTFLGTLLINLAREFISLSLAFGGGAIIYIVSKELIPQSNKLNAQYAIYGITLGFLVSIILSFSNLL